MNLSTPPDNCGSGLAREEAGTSGIFVSRHTAFASKPAPTGGFVLDAELERTTGQSWEQARCYKGIEVAFSIPFIL